MDGVVGVESEQVVKIERAPALFSFLDLQCFLRQCFLRQWYLRHAWVGWIRWATYVVGIELGRKRLGGALQGQ